ncbi:unnamed protein product [Prorocentrum cordatum]|uniref:Uncharacterized protein n=1 Tax=Prorocentrum cordatum TaxID=2364126 RepID=A0ABN9WWI1_9DINO|nr:unnamed protein product [Polarella glacialis]
MRTAFPSGETGGVTACLGHPRPACGPGLCKGRCTCGGLTWRGRGGGRENRMSPRLGAAGHSLHKARRGGKAGTTAGQEGRKGQHSWRPDLSSEARPGRQPAARPFRRSAPGCQARRRGECQRRRRLEHRAAGRGARGVALHGGVREAALVGQRGGLVHRRPHLSEGLQKKTT